VRLSHQERRFNCDPCSKKFARPSHLKDHLKSKEHKRNATLLSDDQAQATSEDPEESSEEISESIMDSIIDSVIQETSQTRRSKRRVSGSSVEVKSARCVAKEGKDGGRWKCETCGKRYTTRQLLRQHVKSHQARQFSCEVCDKKFVFNHHLKEHMVVHTGERPYACQLCDQKYTQPHVLKSHLLKVHGVKSFSCSECHESFARMVDFKRHQKDSANGQCGQAVKVEPFEVVPLVWDDASGAADEGEGKSEEDESGGDYIMLEHPDGTVEHCATSNEDQDHTIQIKITSNTQTSNREESQ